MPGLKKGIAFLFGLLAVVPFAFADMLGPEDLVLYPSLFFFFLFLNFAYNLLVVFLAQKLFLKGFLAKRSFSEITILLVGITLAGLAGDYIGLYPVHYYFTSNFSLAFIAYALPIAGCEFFFLRLRMTKKEAGILSVSLGLLANPALFQGILKVVFNADFGSFFIPILWTSLFMTALALAVLYSTWRTSKKTAQDKKVFKWAVVAFVFFGFLIPLILLANHSVLLKSIGYKLNYDERICQNFKHQVQSMCAAKPTEGFCNKYNIVLPGQLGTDRQCIWDANQNRCVANEKEINWSDSEYCR